MFRGKVEQMCDGLYGGLNTPNYKNVKGMMKDIFGIADIKEYWSWQGMKPDQAATKLDDLVNLRGALAHGGRVRGSLSIGVCQTYNNHIKALVEATDGAVSKTRLLMKMGRLYE
jgi:RiboL-PSP-HEPN